MQVGLARAELLLLIHMHAGGLRKEIEDQLRSQSCNDATIDELISRMAALAHHLFKPPPEVAS